MGIPEPIAALKEDLARAAAETPRPARCPSCRHDRVWWDGWTTRSATVLADDVGAVHIADVRCHRARCAAKPCSFRFVARPRWLAPRQHFQLDVVAAATSAYVHDGAASQEAVARRYGSSRRSLARWLTWIAGLAPPAALARRLALAVAAPVLAAARHVAALAAKPLCAARRRIFERAADVLAHLEALASAEGLEPPGLRSVVLAAVRDRANATTHARPFIPDLARSLGAAARAP